MDIVKLIDKKLVIDDGKPSTNHNRIYSQLVFDDDENRARLDILIIDHAQDIHDDFHINISRKQAVRMIEILEKHVLYNRK